jgi:hypothetical protein
MIFLSYASEDCDRASEIYDRLSHDGFEVWMDKKNILLGQEWENQIWRVAAKADLFCLLLSARLITKRGFVRKEIRFALGKWKEKLPDDVYLIPTRIEKIEPPLELSHLQYIDLTNEEDFQRFEEVLNKAQTSSSSKNQYHNEVAKPRTRTH